jgi:hypothetical protein
MAKVEGYDPTKDRLNRTPRWVHESSDLKESIKDIFKGANKVGKDGDHALALLGPDSSGLNDPQNLKSMNRKANQSKGHRLSSDWATWKWLQGNVRGESGVGKGGRLNAYRKVPSSTSDPWVRVPKSQGGFTNIFTDPKVYKALGKVGLLAAATAGLEYFDPDNPIAQARQRGYKMTDDIGGLMGMNGIKGGIENMEPGFNKMIAGVGDSLFLDPVITALGAGANMGDRLYGEMTGTNKKFDMEHEGKGLMGRLGTQRGLING